MRHAAGTLNQTPVRAAKSFTSLQPGTVKWWRRRFLRKNVSYISTLGGILLLMMRNFGMGRTSLHYFAVLRAVCPLRQHNMCLLVREMLGLS